MTPAPKPKPFTRLPTKDPAVSDLYDKVAGVLAQLDQGGHPNPTPPSNLESRPARAAAIGVRTVQSSARLDPSDTVVQAKLDAVAVLVLPDAAQNPGKVFFLKNSYASDAAFTLGVTNLHQKVDGLDPGDFSVGAGNAIEVQSDGLEWFVRNRYDPALY